MNAFPLLDSAAGGMETQRAALDAAARNAAFAEAAGPKNNANLLQEMVAVMRASRNYEADTALFDTGKRLAQQTIDLERA